MSLGTSAVLPHKEQYSLFLWRIQHSKHHLDALALPFVRHQSSKVLVLDFPISMTVKNMCLFIIY